MNIKRISTKELVDELSLREGIEVTTAEPHDEKTVNVNCPAIVITVIN